MPADKRRKRATTGTALHADPVSNGEFRHAIRELRTELEEIKRCLKDVVVVKLEHLQQDKKYDLESIRLLERKRLEAETKLNEHDSRISVLERHQLNGHAPEE